MDIKNWACVLHRRITDSDNQSASIHMMRAVLWPFAVMYSGIMRLRNRLYDHGIATIRRVNTPIISVGNITAGGTGKTPFVAWLCRHLRKRGYKPAVLSRGYGKDPTTGIDDENEMLAGLIEDIPIVVNPDRVEGAQSAIDQYDADVLVMDDGFQHRRLARDCDIVLLDALDPFGGGYTIPLGTLREPLSGLSRADAVVVTRADQVEKAQLQQLGETIREYTGTVPVAMAEHSPCGICQLNGEVVEGAGDVERLMGGRRWGAFCGIGNPRAFRRTLESLGAEIGFFRGYADHYTYDTQDVNELRQQARAEQCEGLVTTEKDARKIRRLVEGGDDQALPVWMLQVSLEVVAREADLWREVDKVLS